MLRGPLLLKAALSAFNDWPFFNFRWDWVGAVPNCTMGLFYGVECSPAKNVWLVDERPRDIAKSKMAAIPASFVYSRGKKINCGLIWVAKAYTDIFRIAETFYYPFSLIPMGFVPCDARVLAGLPDSTLDSSRSRRTTIFLMKAGSLERTVFVHSSM